MSRKPKYELATMEVGHKIKINTSPETSQKDVHCLRSAISQYRRLHNKPDVKYEISLKEDKLITCKRIS
jgi:hypothetical protein